MATADVSTKSQQLIEQQYDKTVREDIELFRTQADAFTKPGEKLTADQFRPLPPSPRRSMGNAKKASI